MKTRRFAVALAILTAVGVSSFGRAQAPASTKPVGIKQVIDQPDGWFKSAEGEKVVSNIIGWQGPEGGWHKTYDVSKPRPAKETPTNNGLAPSSDSGSVWAQAGTIDNDATYNELRVLARAVRVTGRDDARKSFDRGMGFLLKAQYPNGGFPQRFPLQENYGRHITFNDDAMVGVMFLLREAAAGKGDFEFVPAADREKYATSLEKAVDCVLKCQIVVDGAPTVWGQQHDEVTFAPAAARTFEVPSYCSSESARITQFLMGIEKPDDRVRKAVEGAVAWFEAHKIPGMKYERFRGAEYEKGYDRYLVPDPSGGSAWARFYSLKDAKPLFVDRDGSLHTSERQLGYERRTGYAWYSTAPAKVLEEYPAWKARVKG